MRWLGLALGLAMLVRPASAQPCDLSIKGNTSIHDPAKCRVKILEQNGVMIALQRNATVQVDPAKVARCTRMAAQLMKQLSVKQDDFISPPTLFWSTFTFSGLCASATLECQVLDTSEPALNRAPYGSVSLHCDVDPDRITEALQIIAPATKKADVRKFASICLAAARAKKAEGPQDLAGP